MALSLMLAMLLVLPLRRMLQRKGGILQEKRVSCSFICFTAKMASVASCSFVTLPTGCTSRAKSRHRHR